MSENAFQAPSPEYLAELLPQYDIEFFIAQGGMGAIYKGRQISLDRDIAIKVLPHEMGESEEFRESFTSEAKAMARLNHPNLVGVFDYGDVDGMPFIVMEYVEGGSLHEACWNQVVEPLQAANIVKGICDGLAHAHDHDIVHRDIKPSNVLLTPGIEPKIADFGLAQGADSDTPGLVMGTPGYTAPEVFQDPNQAGKLADIYSVGVILHQLLTGIDPSGSMQPPTQSTGNIRLDAIWRKATNIHPSQRYPAVAAMSAELGKWIAAKQNASVATSRAPLNASTRQVHVQTGGGGGASFKIFLIAALVAALFFTYHLVQKQKEQVERNIAAIKESKASVTPAPEPVPAVPSLVVPPPIEEEEISYAPEPDPVETDVSEEPVSMVEVDDDEPETDADLTPGDPELRDRAAGLIHDARTKRDKGLADNASALHFDLKSQMSLAEPDVIALIESIRESIVDNRVPQAEDAIGIPDKVARSLEHSRAKEESINVSHTADLTRIRDAYVARLEGAVAETSDEDLKKRLVAQSASAKDLGAWVDLLAPDSKHQRRAVTHVEGSGVVGKWDNHSYKNTSRWIAHSGGRMEIVGETWEVTWKLLEDGTLEVDWGKKAPYVYTRDGNDWVGTNPHGGKASLTPGDW